MTSPDTQAKLLEEFGARLNMKQLGKALGLAERTVQNRIHLGTLPIKTYRDGRRRWCDYRDLASYFDECRRRARA